VRRSRFRSARPTTVDRQLEERQRLDEFVESVPDQKLSGPVSPPFHSPKSHWFSVRAGATETDRGNSKCREQPGRTEKGREMERKATAVWRGDVKSGKGLLSTESRVLKEAQVFVPHAI